MAATYGRLVVEANGAKSRFYDSMRRAAPGDAVLSYAAGQVGRVGVVADFAISAPKPEEFGSKGRTGEARDGYSPSSGSTQAWLSGLRAC